MNEDILQEILTTLKDFKDRYIEVEPGKCTEKFGNFVMELMKNGK